MQSFDSPIILYDHGIDRNREFSQIRARGHRRGIAIIERVRTLRLSACSLSGQSESTRLQAAVTAINNTVLSVRPRRERAESPTAREDSANGKSCRGDGKSQVASDKAHTKDYVFFFFLSRSSFLRGRVRVALAKESRVKLYMQIISFLPASTPFILWVYTCRPCYRQRTRNLRSVYIHCVRLYTVSFLPGLKRALISSSSKESACTFACRPFFLLLSGCLPHLFLALPLVFSLSLDGFQCRRET